MRIKWEHIRRAAAYVAGLVVTFAVVPTIGNFFIVLADQHQWYANPNATVTKVMGVFSLLADSQWFHWIGGIIIGFAIGVWLDAVVRLRKEKAHPEATAPQVSLETGAGPSTLSNALRIVFQREPSFFPETEYAEGITRRMVNVALRNEGNGWLSNCRLEVVSIAPPPVHLDSPYAKGALGPSFDMNYRAERKITVAGFNRIPIPGDLTIQYNLGPTIFYSAPGTYGGGAHAILSGDSRSLVRLRATCDQGKPHELDLRIWVDEHRVIQAELA